MKTLNEHVWVIEIADKNGVYRPNLVELTRKTARETVVWLKDGGYKARERKYVPESKDW